MARHADSGKTIFIGLLGLFLVGLPTGTGFAFLYQASIRPVMPQWIQVAEIDELPLDAQPHRVVVTVPANDAWLKQPDWPIGAIFLRRERESGRLIALRTTIAHGSLVNYSPESRDYIDCCWGGRYDLQGNPLGTTAGKPMHPVGVQIRREGVYIRVSDVVGEETWSR